MASKIVYLGIDQGSSSTKGVLLDDSGMAHAEFVVAVPPRLENDREVEQDPEGLLSSVVEVFLKAKQWAQLHRYEIAAAGIAVQRSGVLAWRALDGTVVHPMITWADTRTYPIIQDLGKATERISELTGLPTIPNFAAGKIHLLQMQHLEPSIRVGTLDSFILYRLSARQKFVTEDTMAARTMLYGLKDSSWNERLCRDFRVDRKRLATITPSLCRHAVFEGVPIMALLGDQQAAVLGHGRHDGHALLNLGTIASLLKETGADAIQKTGLMTSVFFSREIPDSNDRAPRYLIETTSPITGTVSMEPVRRGWCNDSSIINSMCEESQVTNPGGVAIAYFVHHRPHPPYFPVRTPNVLVARPEATIADRTRAIVENVGNLIVRMIEEFSEKGVLESTSEIFTAGGGSDLEYLLRYISDVTGRTIHRLAMREATARGAAFAARASLLGLEEPYGPAIEEVTATYHPTNTDRRRRYLQWLRLEQDVLNNRLPAHAEIED